MNIEYWKDRALTAEQKLRDLQEEEPDGKVVAATGIDNDTAMIKWVSHYRPKVGDYLYSAQIPPADVAELRRKLDELEQAAQDEINRLNEQTLQLSKRLEEAKRQAVPEWQPIDTAPKDGSHILLYKPEIIQVGFWGSGSEWFSNAKGCPSIGIPTHWMPLLDFPKPEGV